MSPLKAALTLIRFPNLVFIVLTQALTYACLIRPTLTVPVLPLWGIALLCASTMLIAAAGYLINDYFDIGIDVVNKPERVTIEKVFRRRSIILWHIGLNVSGWLMAALLCLRYGHLRYSLIQIACILLLLVYSTTLKRRLLWGNLSIAVLTALTLLTTAVYEPAFSMFRNSEHALLFWTYAGFAFLITLIREIVKDIEDIRGDAALGCRTIPLQWGTGAAKGIVYGLFSTLLLILASTLYRFGAERLPWALLLGAGVALPCAWLMLETRRARDAADFHRLSTHIKWVTGIGIMSMALL
jgi:4-hydroxybenzoate polyprenyltransferase